MSLRTSTTSPEMKLEVELNRSGVGTVSIGGVVIPTKTLSINAEVGKLPVVSLGTTGLAEHLIVYPGEVFITDTQTGHGAYLISERGKVLLDGMIDLFYNWGYVESEKDYVTFHEEFKELFEPRGEKK